MKKDAGINQRSGRFLTNGAKVLAIAISDLASFPDV